MELEELLEEQRLLQLQALYTLILNRGYKVEFCRKEYHTYRVRLTCKLGTITLKQDLALYEADNE